MSSRVREVCRNDALRNGFQPPHRCRHAIHSTAEMEGVLDLVADEMTASGYSRRDVFGVRLALEEAVVNAIKHGHGGDLSKAVHVYYHVSAEHVLAEVEDQGPGFDPDAVPDPCLPENLERSCGRGLLLMRNYLTWIRYNETGNRVTLCRSRSEK